MLIDGPITTQTIDSSGEILDLKGLDISDFLDGKATANFEHNNDSPENVLGWFTYAKKIFSEADCETERQKMFWDKVRTPFLYGVLELLDDENHPGAVAVAAMLRHFKKKNEPVRIGMSIEGSTLERDGHVLKRTVGRKVAITLRPCNKQCMLDVMPQEQTDSFLNKMESSKIQSFEVDSPILEKTDFLNKNYNEKILGKDSGFFTEVIGEDDDMIEIEATHPKTGKRVGYITVDKYHPEDDSYAMVGDAEVYEKYRNNNIGTDLYTHASNYLKKPLKPNYNIQAAALKIHQKYKPYKTEINKSEFTLINDIKKDLINLRKTLTAGMGNAAPSNLVGGSALSVEGLDRTTRNTLKSVLRDWDRKTPLKKVIKAALPDLSDKYVDHFADLAEDLSLKKSKNFLFHGTSKKQYENLLSSGFKANNIYVGDNRENISDYYSEQKSNEDKSNPVTIIFDKKKLKNIKQDFHDDQKQVGQYIVSGNIKDAIIDVLERDFNTDKEFSIFKRRKK